MTHYHFVGIKGLGLKPLAHYLKSLGHSISGSDRLLHLNAGQGDSELSEINLFPQDGSGVNSQTQMLICSSAIENDNPDILKARKLNIPILLRSELLASLFNSSKGIAIAGTSGKTTTAAMCAYILEQNQCNPSFIIGGSILYGPHHKGSLNWRNGQSSHFLIEADESDGSLIQYHSSIGLITNISNDHKPLPELRKLFQTFLDQISFISIINQDCPHSHDLNISSEKKLTFAVENEAHYQAHHLEMSLDQSTFKLKNQLFQIKLPGLHNIYNAIASITLCHIFDLTLKQIADTLQTFKGVRRRLALIGKIDHIRIYDDYAHNPHKIFSSLSTLQSFSEKVIYIYQPHGFSPLRHQCDDLIELFKELKRDSDEFHLLPVYDMGGSTDRSFGSENFADLLRKNKVPVNYHQTKKNLLETIRAHRHTKGETSILVMGARDPSLEMFSRQIFDCITKDHKSDDRR